MVPLNKAGCPACGPPDTHAYSHLPLYDSVCVIFFWVFSTPPLRTMQVFGSFFRPGFLMGAISSFPKALPNASPQPMDNALGRRAAAAVADERCDEAIARWFDFASEDGLAMKAPTEHTLSTRVISTSVKFIISVFLLSLLLQRLPSKPMPPEMQNFPGVYMCVYLLVSFAEPQKIGCVALATTCLKDEGPQRQLTRGACRVQITQGTQKSCTSKGTSGEERANTRGITLTCSTRRTTSRHRRGMQL